MAIYQHVHHHHSHQRSRTHSRGAKRKNSFQSLSVDLNLSQLGRFFLQTIPAHTSSDRSLTKMAIAEYTVLTSRIQQRQQEHQDHHNHDTVKWSSFRDELFNCVTVVSLFLSSVPTVATNIIFEAHSLIGCIHTVLQNHKLASQSYVKALWIASSSCCSSSSSSGACDGNHNCHVNNLDNCFPMEQLALTLHRLGCSYSCKKRFKDSNDLIEKALVQYHAAGVHRDHTVMDQASALLAENQARIQEQEQQKKKQREISTRALSSPSSSHLFRRSSPFLGQRQTTLSLIKEESSAVERRSTLPYTFRSAGGGPIEEE